MKNLDNKDILAIVQATLNLVNRYPDTMTNLSEYDDDVLRHIHVSAMEIREDYRNFDEIKETRAYEAELGILEPSW